MIFRAYLIISFFFIGISATSQQSIHAWTDIQESKYDNQIVSDDALVFFDRLYINTIAYDEKVTQLKTIHRKIKILTKYGLNSYNKVYIPVYNELFFRSNLGNFKLVILKPGGKRIELNSSNMVETSLPANTPFFYKKGGEVRLLAVPELSVGDIIEYVYTVTNAYDVQPQYFYQIDDMSCEVDHYTIQKSLILESNKFDHNVLPINFGYPVQLEELSEGNGVKFQLNNLEPSEDEEFSHYYLNNKFAVYHIGNNIDDEEMDERELLRSFSRNQRVVNKSKMFDENHLSNMEYELKKLDGVMEKMELIHIKMNQPLEENMYRFNKYIKDRIERTWIAAKVIHKLLDGMNIDVEYHILRSRERSNEIPKNFSIYNFDDIVISFKDEVGSRRFMPLMKPFLNIDEVYLELYYSNCVTIKKNEKGILDIGVEEVPKYNSKNEIFYEASLFTDTKVKDEVRLKVDVDYKLAGSIWYEIKPVFNELLTDTLHLEQNLELFVKYNLITDQNPDSIYNIKYKVEDQELKMSFSYTKSEPSTEGIFTIELQDYFTDEFNLDWSAKTRERSNPGSFYGEPKFIGLLDISKNDELKYVVDEKLNAEFINEFGYLNTSMTPNQESYQFKYEYDFTTREFNAEDWTDVVPLLEEFEKLNRSKIYFEINH